MDRETQADARINDYVLYAMGGAALPVPLVDLAAVTAVQLSLMRELADIYGARYDIRSGQALITCAVGASLPRLGASLIKAIPGAGTLVGVFTQVALSGATTYAVGKVFQRHFEEERELVTLRPERAQGLYQEYLSEGRAVATKLRRSARRARISLEDLAAVLEQLEEMRDRGELSDTELAQLKAQALSNF